MMTQCDTLEIKLHGVDISHLYKYEMKHMPGHALLTMYHQQA